MRTTLFEQKKIASYVQAGSGTPLLFLHGFCADSSIWDDLILKFPDRYIIRIDIPGFGNSEQLENYSIAHYADAVNAVIEDLKIKSFVFIGHSMGGYIALEFSKKYPDLINGLCLFHSHPYADSEEKISARKKSIEFIQKNGSIYYVKQLIPNLFTRAYNQSNHLELAKLVFTASQFSAKNIIVALECMMLRVDNRAILSEAKIPCLFIIGKEDTVVPNYFEETARPNIASIHVLKNVAHMGMLEQPKKCVRIIKDFVNFVEAN